jgi:hypothetical protein
MAASVTINTANTDPNGVWATINSTVESAGKYVKLDLSACTAVGNTIRGGFETPANNHFNIIKSNVYIKGITLPSTLTSIGEGAFYGCSGLTSVTIPGSVTSIGEGAFAYCSGLTSVTIPGSVTSIGYAAFAYCSGLMAFTVAESNTAYSAQDGILYNKAQTTIISVPGAKSGALTLPNTLTSIGYYAFYGCSGLTSVTIPGSVTSIGDGAFAYCSGLTSVTIPGSVTSIGDSAFAYCSSLTSVIFGAGSNITTAWSNYSFPDNNYGYTGDSLWTAYTGGESKPGTYTRSGSTWMQTPAITIGSNYGTITITGSDGVNTISKSRVGGKPISLALNAASVYTDAVWYVDGVWKAADDSVTINAASYPIGWYTVTFTGKRDGILFSQLIPFEVVE